MYHYQHGIIAVVADSDISCLDCAIKRYTSLANLKRAVKVSRTLASQGYFGTLTNRWRSRANDPYDQEIDSAEIMAFGFQHGACLDYSGEKIATCGDYHNTLEDHVEMYCCECNVKLDTIVLHSESSDLECYNLPACICEDCQRAWVNSDAYDGPNIVPDPETVRGLYLAYIYGEEYVRAG